MKPFKIITILISLSLIFSLTSCKPTPEDSIIKNKDHDNLIEKAANGDLTTGNDVESIDVDYWERLSVPNKYVLQKNWGERLTLNVDADITLPNYAVPLIRVEPMDFTQDFIDKVYEALVGDTPMFEQQTMLTKSQIEEQILIVKRSIGEMESGRIEYGEGWASLERIENEKNRLKILESQLSEAPETIEPIPASPVLKKQKHINPETGKEDDGFMGVEIAETPGMDLQNNHGKIFSVFNNSNNIVQYMDSEGNAIFDSASKGAKLLYSNGGFPSRNEYRINIETVTPDNYTERKAASKYITYEEAIRKAEEFIANIGIDSYFKISRVELIYVMSSNAMNIEKEMGSYEKRIEEIKDGKYDDDILDVFINFDLLRHSHGVTVSMSEFAGHDASGNYSRNWEYENIGIAVSNNGIIAFAWNSPYKIIETVVDDANMLPFVQIEETFENMFRAKYDESGVMRNCEINRVTLSLRRVLEQGNIEQGLLVPVWDFYGNIDPPLNNEIMFETAFEEPLLTINAVDGSVIDLRKGY